MTWETIEKFTCDRCVCVFEAPEGTCTTPLGWTRFDLYHGDKEGIPQDGPSEENDVPFFHYCGKCAPGVLQLLESIRLDPSKTPVDENPNEDGRRSRKGKSRKGQGQ